EAAAELVRAGIPTGVLVAPLIPGVNDDPKQVEALLGLLGEAGVESVGGIGLHLRGEVKEIWFDWLREHRPDLVPRYEELYGHRAYLPRAEADRLSKLVRSRSRTRRLTTGGRDSSRPRPATEERPPAEQPRLF
ncbi:MAG: Rv2578c family radical SAM protein, partial [Solirubrobacterales bacterium]